MATNPLRLLIVDDDEQLRQTLVDHFRRQGLEVREAGNGAEALAVAELAPCDIALVDLHVPGMTGIEVLAKLKERQPEMEVLMLTAHGSIETAVQSMKKGAYDYLVKPLQLSELEIHVQRAFEKVRLSRRERQCLDQFTFESSPIRPKDLPVNIFEGAGVASGGASDVKLLREVERRHVREILRQEKGNKVQAARVLGISRRALYRLIAKHKLAVV